MSEIHSAAILPDGTRRAYGASSARFPWWSFTKTALAICAMRLVEEGLLALDAPRPGKPYTLSQLLQHRAGVPNYGGLESYHKAVARGDTPWPRDTLLDAVGGDRLDFAPGTGWAYSNVGYMFVSEAIEAATGLKAGSALHRFVLAPLELSSIEWAHGASDFSDIHWPDGRNYHPGWVYHGCLKGTASDAARLLHALFHGDLLRRESLAAMLDHPLHLASEPGRGNFWVVPGSHLKDTIDMPENGMGQPEGAVPVLAKPGTAVFFDRRLWHAGTPNWSDVTRKVLFYGYGYRWIRTKDDMTVEHLWEGSDPIRRQLLGWGTNANGFYSPRDEDAPLRIWLRDHDPAAAA